MNENRRLLWSVIVLYSLSQWLALIGMASMTSKPKLQHSPIQIPKYYLASPMSRDNDQQQPGGVNYRAGNEMDEFMKLPGQNSTSRYQSEQGVSNMLFKKIFTKYHKAVQVVQPLVVHMDVLLIKVKSTVEKEGIFESVVALFIEWHDDRMEWEPAQFGNITHLSLDPDQVGLPDIAMTNSADHLYAITRDHRFTVRVNSDGLLKYVPTGTARTWCDLKLMTFPFDIQKCSLEFESWSMDNTAMTFDGTSVLRLDTSFVSQQWKICQWKATTYDHTYFTNETFTRVRFDIKVKRKSTFYIINLIFPCSTLSLIQMLVFIISSQDTTADRIGFGTTNLLTLVVFQTIVTEEMPKTSDAVTALSKYVIALIITSAVGIFESVLVERMLEVNQKPPPYFVRRFLKPIPIMFREIPRKEDDDENNNNDDDGDEDHGNNKEVRFPRNRGQRMPVPFFRKQNKRRLLSNGHVSMPLIKTDTVSSCSLDSPVTPLNKATMIVEDFQTWQTNTLSTFIDGSSSVTYNASSDYFQPWQPQTPPSVPQPPMVHVNGGSNNNKHLPKGSPHPNSKNSKNKRRRSSYQSAVTAPKDTEGYLTYRGCLNRSGKMALDACLKCDDEDLKAELEARSRRESSRKPLTARHISAMIKARNSRLWKEMAYKIDCITFTLCAGLGLMIPMMLFLPLIYLDTTCENEDNPHNNTHISNSR